MPGIEARIRIAAALIFVSAALTFQGQSAAPGPSFSKHAGAAKQEAVVYLFPEQVTLPTGKASNVTLHFRIAPGLHINSHIPREDFLIPTVFSIPDGAGVRLEKADYPAGMDITLPIDPKTKLSVYTGDFEIHSRIVATAGNHLVEAKLKFQACDQNACLPPKTIPVAIDVIGK